MQAGLGRGLCQSDCLALTVLERGEGREEEQGKIWSVSADGDATRRAALNTLLMFLRN